MRRQILALALLLLLSLVVGAGNARAELLTLQNGWTAAPFGTSPPEAFRTDGVVHLKGAMSAGTANPAFILPPAMWPLLPVFTYVDLYGANPGFLLITTNGEVSVFDANLGLANASGLVSLDGAKFGTPNTSVTSLTLLNGWTASASGTIAPGAALRDGIVHLRGAIAGGTSPTLFTLPLALRPPTNVYVRVELCLGRKGRLNISPSGDVSVQAFGSFSDAQCFTSLDGASGRRKN